MLQYAFLLFWEFGVAYLLAISRDQTKHHLSGFSSILLEKTFIFHGGCVRIAVILMIGVIWAHRIEAQTSEPLQLRIYTEEYPPFNYTVQGKISGINTELIQLVLDDLAYNGVFEIVPWGRAQRFTQTNSNTCFYSAVRTTEREKMYQWVGPLIKEHVQLFALKPEHPKILNFSDAKKFRIGGQAEDAYTDFGESHGLRIERVTEIPINFERLELGRIDLWLAGSIGGPFIASRKGVTIYPDASSETEFSLWLACNPKMSKTVIQRLNDTIQRMQLDGVQENILKRYQ